MLRRIILFLGLLLAAFFAYRRYDQPAADALLYKIKTLDFKSTDTFTSTIDGKKIIKSETGDTTLTGTKNTLLTGTESGNTGVVMDTGIVMNTTDYAQFVSLQTNVSALSLLAIINNVHSGSVEQRDNDLTTQTGALTTQTGIVEQYTGNTATHTGVISPITDTKLMIENKNLRAELEALRKKATAQAATQTGTVTIIKTIITTPSTSSTTTTPSKLSTRDEEEAEEFLELFE